MKWSRLKPIQYDICGELSGILTLVKVICYPACLTRFGHLRKFSPVTILSNFPAITQGGLHEYI